MTRGGQKGKRDKKEKEKANQKKKRVEKEKDDVLKVTL